MSFDIVMPTALFCTTLASLYLNQKTESKLKSTVEEKQFTAKEGAMLVGLMGVMISTVAFLREYVAPLAVLFMISYSMLLFMFTYVFSNKRWYLGFLPPAVFIALYVLFNTSYVWNLYLVNVFALIFAILITLYIGHLFTWKATLVFAVLLTIVDIVMVLWTGWMVQAAEATFSLRLPVIVVLPTVPIIITNTGTLGMTGLGVGDFFFAGLLAIQTLKKFGKQSALWAIAAMTISFFVGEFLLMTYIKAAFFPATLFIIPGWLILVVVIMLATMLRRKLGQKTPVAQH